MTLLGYWSEQRRRDELQEEADRSRLAARGHQQGLRAGEVNPPRAPEHAAPMVGATAPGGGAGGDLCADGGRSLGLRGGAPGGPEAAPEGGGRTQGPSEA